MQDTQQLILDMFQSGEQTAIQIASANTADTGYTRRAYLVVDKRARNFNTGLETKTWVAMPGLRGTGKSTMLAQMYSNPALAECTKIFTSFDRIKTVNGDMSDFILAAEKFIGGSFENHEKPIALFIDEVQYLEGWAVGLKTILDRSKKIFIYCTGSSALSLQTNTDVARRIDIVKLHPMCFTEYVMMRNVTDGKPIHKPIYRLAAEIRDAMFLSKNAEDAFTKLNATKDRVTAYWQGVGVERSAAVADYLKFGTLPFTLSLPNEAIMWERISRILNESLDRDVTAFGRFDPDTVSKLPQLLFMLASSVEISVNRLARDLKINERTISSVLSALEKTEIIVAIPPKGSHNGIIKKASKYLFTSPAMRAALCNFGGIITPEDHGSLMGKLLEDITGMYFNRLFLDGTYQRAIVEYDTASGGADFIFSSDGTKPASISIEVGANKKTSRQAIQTLQALGGKYGMVITSGSLDVDPSNNVLRVPFEYFLLT